MKVYHQAGFRTVWNLASFAEDGVGHGLIFSPVHMDPDAVNKVSRKVRKVSLFDPQFYVPDSQKRRLNQYDFFPERISDGFSTEDFESVAGDAAKQCVDYQLDAGFEALVIPARYHEEMITDYIQRQRRFTVEPFLRAISSRKTHSDVFVSLPLTVAMISDASYRTELLNWISSYPEITGVYLLVNFEETTKQIQSFDKIAHHVQFIQDMMGADLKVICGYCNTEGLLLSILNPHAVTVGTYENTRSFSVDKFLEEETEMRGPAPRLYLPHLLNWMRWDTVVEIREDHPDLWARIYSRTDYAEELFARSERPHFTQPELYKHHLLLIWQQYEEMQALGSQEKRVLHLLEQVAEARRLYEAIDAEHIMLFDTNCSGDHLPVWNRMLNRLRHG